MMEVPVRCAICSRPIGKTQIPQLKLPDPLSRPHIAGLCEVCKNSKKPEALFPRSPTKRAGKKTAHSND